jgi:hypothetical protein
VVGTVVELVVVVAAGDVVLVDELPVVVMAVVVVAAVVVVVAAVVVVVPGVTEQLGTATLFSVRGAKPPAFTVRSSVGEEICSPDGILEKSNRPVAVMGAVNTPVSNAGGLDVVS